MIERESACKGCLLGLAVGDAMGYTVDGKTWDEIREDYGPNGLLGYDLANGSAELTWVTVCCWVRPGASKVIICVIFPFPCGSGQEASISPEIRSALTVG